MEALKIHIYVLDQLKFGDLHQKVGVFVSNITSILKILFLILFMKTMIINLMHKEFFHQLIN